MKKQFFLVLAALAVCFSATLASCDKESDDDRRSTEDTSEDTNFAKNVKFEVFLTEDYFKVADIAVRYTDSIGGEHIDTITSDYVRSFTVNQFPMSGEFRLVCSMKEGADPTQRYVIEDTLRLTTDGGYLDNHVTESCNVSAEGKTLTGDSLVKQVNFLNVIKFVWAFDENGNVTKNDRELNEEAIKKMQ